MAALQYVKLILYTVFVLYCFYRERDDLVLVFLALSLACGALHARIFSVISGSHVIGIIFFPIFLKKFGELFRSRAWQLRLLMLLGLVIGGLIYGFILPWPDTSGARPWTQAAPGRAFINTTRHLVEVSLFAYLVDRVRQNPRTASKMLRFMVYGTTVAAAAVLVETVFAVDLFGLLSPEIRSTNFVEINRARGLNGEPRSSAAVIAIGLLILFISRSLRPLRPLLIPLHAVALILCVSTLGFLIVTIGTGAFLLQRGRFRLAGGLTAALATAIFFFNTLNPQLFDQWQQHNADRIGSDSGAQHLTIDRSFQSQREEIANFLEVFDGAGFLFLTDRVEYLAFGVGPGLMGLAATPNHIPPNMVHRWDRLDSLPHMGFLRMLSNGGLFRLGLWIAIIALITVHLRRLETKLSNPGRLIDFRIILLTFAILFLMQSKMAYKVVFALGMGLTYFRVSSANKSEKSG